MYLHGWKIATNLAQYKERHCGGFESIDVCVCSSGQCDLCGQYSGSELGMGTAEAQPSMAGGRRSVCHP